MIEANILKNLKKAEKSHHREIKCPFWHHKLDQVIWPTIKSNVIIEQCSQGDGLWFDRGGLLEIIQFGFNGINSNVVDLLKDIFGVV